MVYHGADEVELQGRRVARMLLGLLRVLIAFVLACFVAGIVQVGFAVGWQALLQANAEDRHVLEWILLTATHTAVFTAPFALIAVSIAEWQALRSLVFHMIWSIATGLAGFLAQYQSELPGQPSIANEYALMTYVSTGVAAGIVYWMFSGRYSGNPERVEIRPRLDAPKPADEVKA